MLKFWRELLLSSLVGWPKMPSSPFPHLFSTSLEAYPDTNTTEDKVFCLGTCTAHMLMKCCMCVHLDMVVGATWHRAPGGLAQPGHPKTCQVPQPTPLWCATCRPAPSQVDHPPTSTTLSPFFRDDHRLVMMTHQPPTQRVSAWGAPAGTLPHLSSTTTRSDSSQGHCAGTHPPHKA